jgi:hypothetical protein
VEEDLEPFCFCASAGLPLPANVYAASVLTASQRRFFLMRFFAIPAHLL